MTGYLRRFPHCSVLTDADVDILERVFIEETVQPGHVFVREGEVARAQTAQLFLVIAGAVEVTAAKPDGGFGIQRTLGPGTMFGQLALIADIPRTATCRAATTTTVARMDRRVFEELNRRDAGVHARFQLILARQVASDARSLADMLARAASSGDDASLKARFG